MKINNLNARKILNSAGNWTIECALGAEGNKTSTASVPQGISTGKDEKEIVSSDQGINQIKNEILPKVKNQDLSQEELDKILETGSWGSNATLAVSAAFFKLNIPRVKDREIPQLMMLIFEGEKHGNPNLTIQEFMLITNKLEEGISFYQKASSYLKKQGLLDTIGSEGGFSPAEFNDEDVLNVMKSLGVKRIALDVAGNINPPSVNSLLDIVRRYPIMSLEDPFPENKPDQWKEFHIKAEKLNPEILIIADDLTVTDVEKIKSGAKENLFNAVVIKPNQQGTITAAAKALQTAKNLGIKTVVSHRGEETNDTWLADFALAFNADYAKFGAPARGERVAKYNKLLGQSSPRS